MAGKSSRSDAVVADLLAAGVTLLRQGGIRAVTVRGLAAQTYYSPSTIGYHTAPFEDFVHRLWRKVGIDLATHALTASRDEDWAQVAATTLLAWVDDAPLLSEFFLTHGAQPPDGYGVDEWSFLDGMDGSLPGDETLVVLQYLARRFQLALDRAVRWPGDRTTRHEILAEELVELDREWRRFVGGRRSAEGDGRADRPSPPSDGA